MMSVPFFAAAIALAVGWSGGRGGAVVLAALAVAATVALFAVHATDSLAIAL